MSIFNSSFNIDEVLKKGVSLVRKGVNSVKKVKDGRSADGSFIAISDFHGYEYPLEKVKEHYLNEYDYIYILGDATDRGPTYDGAGSIKLLQDIKELSEMYPGRVFYLPGNHDSFLLGAAKGDDSYRYNTYRNGGAAALEELDRLKRFEPQKFNELFSWLENLPLQKAHVYDDQKYVFAHAFFNQRLYNMNPNFSLKDYFNTQDSKLKKDLFDVLWFRKSNDDYYSVEDCPTADSIMVIGHTPVDGGPESYDLIDKNNRKVKVHCVDGGIAYSGCMLKFDGGFEPLRTEFYYHVNTSPKRASNNVEAKKPIERPVNNSVEAKKPIERPVNNSDEAKKPIERPTNNDLGNDTRLLNSYILKRVYEEGKYAFDVACNDIPGNILSVEGCMNIINSYEGKNGFSYNNCSNAEAYSLYKKAVVFDMILQKLMTKYDDLGTVDMAMSGFIFGGTEAPAGSRAWITRDDDVRMFATTLGVQNMKQVLAAYNCTSVGEYMNVNADKVRQHKI